MTNKEKENLRRLFADYRYYEGCGCCSNRDKQRVAEDKIATILETEAYEDGSGWNWYKYKSEK